MRPGKNGSLNQSEFDLPVLFSACALIKTPRVPTPPALCLGRDKNAETIIIHYITIEPKKSYDVDMQVLYIAVLQTDIIAQTPRLCYALPKSFNSTHHKVILCTADFTCV